ncbi:MAG: prepilin-type N-terminal cleavage/methylation domain-containing protein [Candidatus Gastranaerophilales bacterium]|nr:prepilin-type N-terminal cleavage/methylation domain-containing protein [Candidatus Gastranaerophilales bacterium]
MRLKKGFTLAEILIVLMVIGALATMTIPSLMKGVNEAQWKTAYKKAYNAIVNLTAMERISGSLPSTADKEGTKAMFHSLNKNLSVKDYAEKDKGTGVLYAAADYKSSVGYTDPTGAATSCEASDTTCYSVTFADSTLTPWIIAEDNIAYSVVNGKKCSTKAKINAQTSTKDAIDESCVYIMVDVNGLSNGPNKMEPQAANLASSKTMDTLTGDRFYIFVGSDGATAGNKRSTVTGRIAGDLK